MYIRQNLGKTVNCKHCDKEFVVSDETCGMIKGNDGDRFTCSTKCFINYVRSKEKQKDEKTRKKQT